MNATEKSLNDHILQVQNLSISFGENRVVDKISFELKKGEILGIVGESGSGKTVSVRSLLQLVEATRKEVEGTASFQSHQLGEIDLLKLENKSLQKIRGKEVGMIFQEPGRALNPVFKCGNQMVEVLRLHHTFTKREAKDRAFELFEEVGLAEIERMFHSYPHQLSGGQKQRVMIALALAGSPQLLIADEPTTSLDIEIQKHIIDLLKSLQMSRKMSMIIISHDLNLISRIAKRILVMKNGKIVEKGLTQEVLGNPQSDYTKALLACRPSLNEQHKRLLTLNDFSDEVTVKPEIVNDATRQARHDKLYHQSPLWDIRDLSTSFSKRKNPLSFKKEIVQAVKGAGFCIYPGETLGLVGASGSGKTTLGRSLLRLIEPDHGILNFEGQDIRKLRPSALRKLRPRIQIIFQDPFQALNPRIKIGQAIEEPMRVHGIGMSSVKIKKRVHELLEKVGLKTSHYDRYPHAFSGGERQRISIARALALNPTFIVCDECVSSLDVSIQAQILNLLKDLQEADGLTYLFISHDLRVIRQMCDRVMVMKDGEIVEIAKTEEMISQPKHGYTKRLIDASL